MLEMDSIIASKRSRTAPFCQALSANFTENMQDRDIPWHRRTVPVNAAVFFIYHSGVDPGGSFPADSIIYYERK